MVQENAAFHIAIYFFTNYCPHLCGRGLYLAHEIEINKAVEYVEMVQQPFL